ncbi:MAG: prephenate dehydrogenase/arogenate dehydrogenase family protein [Acidovorax sp.]|jgi:prephenate dehydrogenase|nr:prephenate dehydrogenase/arogenate dehydrogenase family protein [Acidovorax sp.]
MFEQLGLIGCGLMGGSFALALKKAGLVRRVVGYSKSPATTARALQLGVIDSAVTEAAQAAAGSDLVLLAVPVAATEATLRSIRTQLTAQTLVMDVGSTKVDVAQAAAQALGDQLPCFVPAHPITGKEVAGVDHADAQLYQGAQVVLTPTALTQDSLVQRAQALWQALGCRVSVMAPELHDNALAAVSHLPHLLAFAMMRSMLRQADGDTYLSLAGPGFRDFTRIGAGDPQIWRDILLANKKEVLAQAREFQLALQELEQAMETDDATALQTLLTSASQSRLQWTMGQAMASVHKD